jgi:hypothetical protein
MLAVRRHWFFAGIFGFVSEGVCMVRVAFLMIFCVCSLFAEKQPESVVEKLVNLSFEVDQLQTSMDNIVEGLQGQMVYGFQNEFFQLTNQKSEAMKEKLYEKFIVLEEGLKQKLAEGFKANWFKAIRDFQMEFYRKNFTSSEIEEIYAFNTSPTGRKFLRLAVPMSNESMNIVHGVIEKLAVETENEFRQKLMLMLEETEKAEKSAKPEKKQLDQ